MRKRRSGFGARSAGDADLLAAALFGFEQQRTEIEAKIADLRRQLGGRAVRAAVGGSDGTRPTPKRAMSAAGRRRIAAAQRKRWAAYKTASRPATVKQAAPVKKRKISAAGRKRMAEATKKRWAEFRAKKAG